MGSAAFFSGSAGFHELARDLREQGVGQNVLLAAGDVLGLLAVLRQLWLEQVSRAAGDDLVIANALAADFLIYFTGQLAVFAAEQALGFLRDHLVALTGDDVHNGLRADDLARRGDERRIAEVLADAGHLSQNIVIAILLTCLLELAEHVREHAAGDLIHQGLRIDLQDLRIKEAFLLQLVGDLAEVRGSLVQLGKVQPGVAVGALQRRHEGLGCGLGRAVGKRRQRAVHDVHTGLTGHEVDHVAGTGRVVRVQVDGHGDAVLQLAHEVIGVQRQQQVRHILDADGICAHLLEVLGEADEVIVVMHRADGVAQRNLGPAAVLLHGLNSLAQVADVVQRIEDADDIDAVFDGLLAEFLDDIVGIVLVAQNVLAAEEHLQLRLGHVGLQGAQALPRVLVQEAHADVKRRTAPALQRPVAHVVQELAGTAREGIRYAARHSG